MCLNVVISEICKKMAHFSCIHAFLGFTAHGCKMNIFIQSDFEIDFALCHSSSFIRVWFPSCFAED